MKILLLGVFAHGSTDVWKATALRRAGHRVLPFPYREREWSELFVIGEPWDLVIVSKGVPLPPEAFVRLTEISKARLLWWPDPWEQWSEALTCAIRPVRESWSLAATSSVVLSRIRDAVGAGLRCARILEGADCEGPMPGLWTGRVEPALLHFGHLSERRKEVIDRLTAAGVPVHHLDQPLYGAELQREVLRHAAVLGINSSPDLYSNRVQTVLAMGGRMLQEDAPSLLCDFDGLGARSDSLRVWTTIAECVAMAKAACEQSARVDERLARCAFEDFGWERWAERVLQLACPAEVRT